MAQARRSSLATKVTVAVVGAIVLHQLTDHCMMAFLPGVMSKADIRRPPMVLEGTSLAALSLLVPDPAAAVDYVGSSGTDSSFFPGFSLLAVIAGMLVLVSRPKPAHAFFQSQEYQEKARQEKESESRRGLLLPAFALIAGGTGYIAVSSQNGEESAANETPSAVRVPESVSAPMAAKTVAPQKSRPSPVAAAPEAPAAPAQRPAVSGTTSSFKQAQLDALEGGRKKKGKAKSEDKNQFQMANEEEKRQKKIEESKKQEEDGGSPLDSPLAFVAVCGAAFVALGKNVKKEQAAKGPSDESTVGSKEEI